MTLFWIIAIIEGVRFIFRCPEEIEELADQCEIDEICLDIYIDRKRRNRQ